MGEQNPYEAPGTPSASTEAGGTGASLLLWSVAVVAGCCLAGGLLGLAIGALLGLAVPNYYRTVFGAGNDPGFDPVSVGIGLGTSQGLFVGALVGVSLVALHYWYRSRLRRQ